MAQNIIKLAVGADSIEDLVAWQAGRLKQLKKAGKPPRMMHVTRMTPKRREEILAGGSLYWVIKGYTGVRQPILDLVETTKNGMPHCGIVYDPRIVLVSRRPTRAFQGWRYLDPRDAPKDLPKSALDLPQDLQRALAELGLL